MHNESHPDVFPQEIKKSVGQPFESHSGMTHSIICTRAFAFAVRIVNVCDRMAASGFGARHIAGQLLRCGTSVGANAEEAQEAQSKPDYIAKMSIANKEARESNFWLRLAIATSSVQENEVGWEIGESNELRYMIRAAIRTARSSASRDHDESS